MVPAALDSMGQNVGLLVAVFVVALLYSAVGHGGASGYLAAASLFSLPTDVMSSAALILNVFVAGIAFLAYRRAGAFQLRLIMPFAVGSVPAAFLGGVLAFADPVFSLLLAAALFAASVRFFLSRSRRVSGALPPLWLAVGAGSLIGFVSGVVGIGGGVFLSPLLLLAGWAAPRQAAAASSAFIVLNALSGLAGRFYVSVGVPTDVWPLVIAAIPGGFIGSWLGSRWLMPTALNRVLGVVLFVAAVKLLLKAVGP